MTADITSTTPVAGPTAPISRGRRHILAAGGLLVTLGLLGGCGYQPVYGSRGADIGSDKLQNIAIDTIADRSGQELRNLLIDRFYRVDRPSNPKYRLSINLTSATVSTAIQKDTTATRAQMSLVASYTLFNKADGKSLFSTNSRAIVDFNILSTQYGSLVTQQDATDRGIALIADDIALRLALYFDRV
ncbi:MAG: LPS assembly lipoprotein LptE [Acidobacteriaceae bacterium]|nr:LPS assembly lipoprotein LptE [Acidobacteriaceae bacterium]